MNKLELMARAELERCAAIVAEHEGAPYALVRSERVTVRYDIRGRLRRGVAFASKLLIRLNPGYYAAVGDAYRQTVAHEYAHLVQRRTELVRNLGRERPHGPLWQSLMVHFGYPPVRSSDYGVYTVPRARRTRRFIYRCINGGHELTAGAALHKRLQSGNSIGHCPRCTGPKDERGIAFDREET